MRVEIFLTCCNESDCWCIVPGEYLETARCLPRSKWYHSVLIGDERRVPHRALGADGRLSEEHRYEHFEVEPRTLKMHYNLHIDTEADFAVLTNEMKART